MFAIVRATATSSAPTPTRCVGRYCQLRQGERFSHRTSSLTTQATRRSHYMSANYAADAPVEPRMEFYISPMCEFSHSQGHERRIGLLETFPLFPIKHNLGRLGRSDRLCVPALARVPTRRPAHKPAERGAESARRAITHSFGDLVESEVVVPEQIFRHGHAPGEEIFHRR